MKLLKGILSIMATGGLTLALTSCCHWKNCHAKANNDGMREMGMDANLLHRPPLAHPATNCCSDELIADGSFEFESSSANLTPPMGQYLVYTNPLMIGPWFVSYTEPATSDLDATHHASGVGIFANNYSTADPKGPLLHPTVCGNVSVYLGLAGEGMLIGANGSAGMANGNGGPYPSNVLSQTIYTELKAGKHYHLCFLQSAFAYQPLESIGGEVQIELDNAQNIAVFSGDWTVNPGRGWVMQNTNILIHTDGWYTIKLISCSTTNVAIIDGVSLRGPH